MPGQSFDPVAAWPYVQTTGNDIRIGGYGPADLGRQ